MTKKPLLSVLIPAYNIEDFIENTIKSITDSDCLDYVEILVVNDGSSDNTSKIARKLAENYKQIKVIDKLNGGHGSTINVGIKKASGKYFKILDGDDWFDTAVFDKFIEHLRNETSDLVICDYTEHFIKSGKKEIKHFYKNLPTYKPIELETVKFKKYGPLLHTLTVKTALLRKADFKIDEHSFYVDQEYNFISYLVSRDIVYYPLSLYQYRLERDGQSMAKDSLRKNVSSHEKIVMRLIQEYSKNEDKISMRKRQYIKTKMIIPLCHLQYTIAIKYCKSRDNFLSFDKKLSRYSEFYNNPGVAGTILKFHRKTKGTMIIMNGILEKLAKLF